MTSFSKTHSKFMSLITQHGRKESSESDDSNRLPRNTSVDSVASLTFPWRLMTRNRPTLVADNQAGREIDPAGYFLCMCSVMLLSSGIGICVATVWSFLHTIPYIYLIDSTVLLGTNTFSLCAGILGIPCCWIGWTAHDARKNYTLLPLLMVLLGFSSLMLATSSGAAIIYKSRINFDTKSTDRKLLSGYYKNLLNETLYSSMATYSSNYNYRGAWDKIQSRLKCCGSVTFLDWKNVGKKIPSSCCANGNCKDGGSYTKGCLDKVAFDLMWQISLISGLSLTVFAVQMFTFGMASYMYIRGRLEPENSTEFICTMHSSIGTPTDQ